MLIEKPTPVKNILKFTKGKLRLVLTTNSTWKFEQDVENTKDIVEQKTFTFGERYGIIKYDNYDRTFININGKKWYLSTLTETMKPVLKDIAYKYTNIIKPNYLELREVDEYAYSIAW